MKNEVKKTKLIYGKLECSQCKNKNIRKMVKTSGASLVKCNLSNLDEWTHEKLNDDVFCGECGRQIKEEENRNGV